MKICSKTHHSKKFLGEACPRTPLEVLNIYDKLKTLVNSDLKENYDIMLLSTAKEKQLPKIIVKFDKRKHKKAKWMINGLLKSINTKDRLYKKLISTDIEDPQYVTLKNEFTNFKNTLRRSINEAKRLSYMRTFALYKNAYAHGLLLRHFFEEMRS